MSKNNLFKMLITICAVLAFASFMFLNFAKFPINAGGVTVNISIVGYNAFFGGNYSVTANILNQTVKVPMENIKGDWMCTLFAFLMILAPIDLWTAKLQQKFMKRKASLNEFISFGIIGVLVTIFTFVSPFLWADSQEVLKISYGIGTILAGIMMLIATALSLYYGITNKKELKAELVKE